MSTKKDQTRLRLLDAARKLMVERGYHAVGLEEIATEAGVSRQAVYKSHFTSKADLVLALVRHVDEVEGVAELLKPAMEARTGLDMLEQAVIASVRIEARVHDIALVIGAAAHIDAGAAAAFRDRMDGKRAGIATAVRRVRAEGHLNPAWKVDHAVDAIATMLSVDVYQRLVVEAGWKPEMLIDKVWSLCLGSILTRGK
jgi:AcrR family transcriptional regulator